ncbi:ribose-phosphate diphosphokinase [Flavobacterium sp. RNTU_13]|uniref:ribose-phosphate diphosphokinase n=1 Tax=Flavobacterium sp. RNTU_13 TaxID=3375145 RepID=UPI003985B437
MVSLNLDPDFTPFGKTGLTHKLFTFYGGEPHIKIEEGFDVKQNIIITHRLSSFNALGEVCVATDALKHMGAKNISLFIPYMPGARQDRVMIPGEPLTAKVYADIINSLGFAEVIIFDAHSDVVPALLNNVTVLPNHSFIAQVMDEIGNVTIASPDAGALKKIYKLSEHLGGAKVVECGKYRDVNTGKLAGFRVYEDDLNGADILVVDDICDGGGTFAGIADALKAKGAGKLYLAVSHGIFSKGFDVFAGRFEKVFTTNSFRYVEETNIVKQFKIQL